MKKTASQVAAIVAAVLAVLAGEGMIRPHAGSPHAANAQTVELSKQVGALSERIARLEERIVALTDEIRRK